MEKKLSEAGRQFAEIWEELHDPDKQNKKRILDNRQKREEETKEDLGI